MDGSCDPCGVAVDEPCCTDNSCSGSGLGCDVGTGTCCAIADATEGVDCCAGQCANGLDCVGGTCVQTVTSDQCQQEGIEFEGNGCTNGNVCCLNSGTGGGYSCKGCSACRLQGKKPFTNDCCGGCDLLTQECCATGGDTGPAIVIYSCVDIGTCI